jgi:phenylpropionate dioxygenase-like ring-hydroxylating dioxygenase large terminal subunit
MTEITPAAAFDQRLASLPEGFLPEGCSYMPDDGKILARCWFPVARVEDAGDKPLAVKLLDLPLVVYRAGTQWVVARDQCPHRGVPLSMGWIEGEEIVCGYHGLRFGADGACRKIPAQPRVVPGARFALTSFATVERYGLVWTCLDPEPASDVGAIPPFPQWDDAAFQAICPPPVAVAAAPGRQVEGFLDVAHFAWIHHEAFADRDQPEVPLYSTRTTDYGLKTEYRSTISNFPKALQDRAPADFMWLREFDVFPPFAARLTVHFPGADRLVILNLASPVSARETMMFSPLVRNFDTTGPVEDVYAFNAQIFAEDKRIVEAQRPQDLPLDPDEEAHFAADKSSITYRKLLRNMGLTLKGR